MSDSPATQIRRALHEDAKSIHQLRLNLEEWLEGKGVQQWGRGEVSEQEVIGQIDAQEWYVCCDEDRVLLAAERVLWSDPGVWDEDTVPAVYVHGLMVNRAAAGLGLGARMLEWAAELARTRDKHVFRLDCAESNTRLRAFYREQGFNEVGRRDFDGPWFSATLLEKSLSPSR